MMNSIDRRSFLRQGAGSLLASALASPPALWAAASGGHETDGWKHYGGDAGASRFSPLDQINRSNVHALKVAWVHPTEDARQRPATTIECTPIIVGGVMYLTTARLQVRALNAATGEVLWNFDPYGGASSSRSRGVNRGVTYFEDGKDKRIFAAIQTELFCLNAETGEPIRSFGNRGVVDLTQDFDRDMTELFYKCTSPPVVYEDVLIVGGGGGEGPRPTGPGHIRGYDVYTGKRRWIFHTIPFPGEFGYETWSPDSWKINGGANNWGGMSLDPKRGWVFASTGSPSFDFWGGDRIGQNLFGDCVLALDAKTGKRIWHYQTVHHDVWDYDLPAQPALITVRQGGRPVEAVAQVTKQGMLFLLDRESGEPLFPVEERPVPPSDVPGEKLWPTQPFPVKPAPFSRQVVNEDLLTDISPEAHKYAKELLGKLRAGRPYEPPSKQGSMFSPGTLGGALWGGCCFDPRANRIFVNASELPSIITILDARPGDPYPFRHKGYDKFVDPEGYPAVKPPWGTLTAIDMATGEFVWRAVLGEYPALTARGVPKTGTPSVCGSIATGGGLVFIGATSDERFRAFDSVTGETLWEHQLNAGGYATPCTYEVNGRQYVVIAAGGGNRGGTKSGDEFVAFALG